MSAFKLASNVLENDVALNNHPNPSITNGKAYPIQLQTKIIVDKVAANSKPLAQTKGLKEKIRDSGESPDKVEPYSHTLSQSPNFYKHNGDIMSQIPFQFVAIPQYFYTSGWLDQSNPIKFTKRMIFLNWAFGRCSTKKRIIEFNGCSVELNPYEFIYGRESSAKSCKLTEEELRHQLKCHENRNFIQKCPQPKKNRYTVYKWLPDNFCEINPQPNPQPNPHNLYGINKEYIDKKRNDNEEFASDASPFLEESIKNESEHFKIIWDYLEKNEMTKNETIPNVTKQDLKQWLSGKYSVFEVFETIKQTKESGSVNNYPRYIQGLLNKQVIKNKKRSKENKEYAQGVVERSKMTNIRFMKDYFVDEINGQETYYHIEKKEITEILRSSYNGLMESKKEKE